jgi:hypothetical protein
MENLGRLALSGSVFLADDFLDISIGGIEVLRATPVSTAASSPSSDNAPPWLRQEFQRSERASGAARRCQRRWSELVQWQLGRWQRVSKVDRRALVSLITSRPLRSVATTHVLQLVNLLDGLLDDLAVKVVSDSLNGNCRVSGFASGTTASPANYLIVNAPSVGNDLIGSNLEGVWKVINRLSHRKSGDQSRALLLTREPRFNHVKTVRRVETISHVVAVM